MDGMEVIGSSWIDTLNRILNIMKTNTSLNILAVTTLALGGLSGCATTNDTGAKPKKLSQEQIANTRSRSEIWRPGDPMPTNVLRLRLAGDFAVKGTNSDSNPIFVPAQDASNPFARQFWLVNVFDRMGPNVMLPMGQRPLVQVTPKRPLVIISRGILPGVYNVAYE
jgi:hypothetical protein